MVGQALEQRGGYLSVVEDLRPLAKGKVGGDYVESRVKLADWDSPSTDPFSTRPESGLRASVGPPSAG